NPQTPQARRPHSSGRPAPRVFRTALDRRHRRSRSRARARRNQRPAPFAGGGRRSSRLAHIPAMTDSSGRRWTATYLTVIATEAVWLLGLWWLGHHFGF